MIEQQQSYQDSKVHYSRITYSKRMRLIQMVQFKHYSIYKAAKQLGISNSTAKLILKNYREGGKVFQKKGDKIQAEKRKLREQKKRVMDAQNQQQFPQVKVQPEIQDKTEQEGQFNRLVSQIIHLNHLWLQLNMKSLLQK